MTDELRVVLMTAPDVSTARELARRLIEERLAACVNIVPGLVSVFRWEGEVQEESEVLLVLKTTAMGVPVLVERAATLHPYDVPEVLALSVGESNAPYRDWVHSEVGGAEEDG